MVDGSAESRTVTHRFFQKLGYENVAYAQDGGPALRLLAQNKFQLVLADWDMAPVNGLQLLTEMRTDQRSKRLPFIMVIENSPQKFLEIARDGGRTLYLRKPFTADLLAERMAEVYLNASEGQDVRPQTGKAIDGLVIKPAASLVPALWQSLRQDP